MSFNENRVQSAVEEIQETWEHYPLDADDLVEIHSERRLHDAILLIEDWVSSETWNVVTLTWDECVEIIRRLRDLTRADYEELGQRLLRRIEQILQFGSAADRDLIAQAVRDAENAAPESSTPAGTQSSSSVG